MRSASRHAEHLALLLDFQFAYDNFALKVIDIDDQLSLKVVEPMQAAISDCVKSVQTFDLSSIRARTRPYAQSGYFLITLDGGSYFNTFDYNFEITRSTFFLEHAANGPYFRLPRDVGPQLIQQGLQLRQIYQEVGSSKPIVLCDDGIGTGKSLGQIIDILENLNLHVHKIIVLLNPSRLHQIGEVDVETIIDIEEPYIWLSERDLYWGLPRSGLSFSKPDQVRPIFGIPYTIDKAMVESRIGIKGEAASWFRMQCLRLNAIFWEYLEHHHNRSLEIEDCARISFLAEEIAPAATRVVDFLNLINYEEYGLPLRERV